MVEGAAREWIPIFSGVPQGSVLGPLLFILFTSEMFELVENRLYAYADDSTLLAVVRKQPHRPPVAAFLNRDLARIQELCNHWYMILNPNKIKASVVSRSRTVSPPHADLILAGVSIRASPNLDILGVKFDSKLAFEDHVHGIIVYRVSQRIDILRLVKRIFVGTPELFRCYFEFVLPILEGVNPPVWGSAAECHIQLFERQVHSVAWLCPDQSFLLLCHRRRVAGLSMLHKVNSNCNQCLFSEFKSASNRVQQPELRPQHTHWSLEYQGIERPNLLGLSCRLRFECGMTFPTLGLTPERGMASRSGQPLVASLSCVFFSFPWRRCL